MEDKVNGWGEMSRLVMDKLKNHDEELKEIKNGVQAIQMRMHPSPCITAVQMQERVDSAANDRQAIKRMIEESAKETDVKFERAFRTVKWILAIAVSIALGLLAYFKGG